MEANSAPLRFASSQPSSRLIRRTLGYKKLFEMKSGIKFEDIKNGNGLEAQADDYVLVECHFFLNQGERIEIIGNYHENQFVISLKSRDFIPGLRYGIVGMLEGGTRKLKISPHLAFGEKGVPDKIPPNALLICEVKLLKIVDKQFLLPNQFSRKRQLIISHRGEAASKKPRWIFGIINDVEYELSINHPISGMTWRHTRNKNHRGTLTREEMDQIFKELLEFPISFPNDIVKYDNVWADMSEKAGNTPRERGTNLLCLHVSSYEKDKLITSFYVTEDNKQFQNTRLYKYISGILAQPEMQ